MARIYGHKWTSIVKVDDGTWLDGLRGISPDQVIEGLGRLVDEGVDWAPTLPEFKKRGLQIDERRLDSFIYDYAVRGMDTFTKNQLTIKQIDIKKNQVRNEATREFIKNQLQLNSAILKNNVKQINGT